jgi:hypothetical protein
MAAPAVRRSIERKRAFAQIRVLKVMERSPAVGTSPKLCGLDVALGDRCGVMAEQEVDLSPSLNDRAVAHPATGCGSNNNGEERKKTYKKATADNSLRQPVLATNNISGWTFKED